MKIDNLTEAALNSRLLSYDGDLWHVESVGIEQVDPMHRPTEAGGRLNDYLNRRFEATLKHPDIGAGECLLSGYIEPDRTLVIQTNQRTVIEESGTFPTDKELQWEEMKDERV